MEGPFESRVDFAGNCKDYLAVTEPGDWCALVPPGFSLSEMTDWDL